MLRSATHATKPSTNSGTIGGRFASVLRSEDDIRRRTQTAATTGALALISQVQVAALAAALFGMGAGVKLRSLLRRSGPVLAVAAASTVFVAGISLAGILLLGQ